MSSWIGQVGDSLRTIYDEMKREMFAGGYLQVDETPVKYLSPGNGRTKQGYLWAYLSPGRAILFDWNTGRGAGCLRPMLEGFEGRVQCDGYAAYTAYNDWRIANKLTRLPLHACWAHARRKFVEARGVPLADEVLLEIQKLYRVEDKLREGGVSVEQRRLQRSKHSKPAIDQIESLMSQASHVLPQSPMGKAVGYTRSLWPKLTSYIDHGQVEIDNNLVENAIRPTALGRKNYMFFGSAEAGQASAIIYSVVQTCRMLEINVRDYLVDVFNRLPYATANEAREMTPSKWKLVLEHQAATNAA